MFGNCHAGAVVQHLAVVRILDHVIALSFGVFGCGHKLVLERYKFQSQFGRQLHRVSCASLHLEAARVGVDRVEVFPSNRHRFAQLVLEQVRVSQCCCQLTLRTGNSQRRRLGDLHSSCRLRSLHGVCNLIGKSSDSFDSYVSVGGSGFLCNHVGILKSFKLGSGLCVGFVQGHGIFLSNGLGLPYSPEPECL